MAASIWHSVVIGVTRTHDEEIRKAFCFVSEKQNRKKECLPFETKTDCTWNGLSQATLVAPPSCMKSIHTWSKKRISVWRCMSGRSSPTTFLWVMLQGEWLFPRRREKQPMEDTHTSESGTVCRVLTKQETNNWIHISNMYLSLLFLLL